MWTAIRQPAAEARERCLSSEALPYGWRYTSVQRFTPPSAVAPLGVPAAPIPVAALLP
jgi:hypothetical protein